MDGIQGAQKINDLMERLRNDSPKSFGGIKIKEIEDFKMGKRINEDGIEETIDMPSADVLKYRLVDSSWIAARPSGTEPKIKFYIAAFDDSGVAVEEKITAFEKAIQRIVEDN